MSAEPRFFKDAAALRRWLEKNHATARELIVGFHKASSGKTGVTHREALDEALCFGWIDGLARGGETAWLLRFTPRRAKSIWSAINIKRVEELKAAGRMHAAGLAAYEACDPERQKRYSGENRDAALAPEQEQAFRANRKAWEAFSAMPPSYRRPAIWWVVSAKREETRQRRLATLIADSAAGRRIKPLTLPPRKT
jgi:uncharacterized protein YdeI (YjbR/CyaY-like superfamily)